MCFYLNDDTVKKVAQEDIRVFKVLKISGQPHRGISPLQNHPYDLGTTYRLDGPLPLPSLAWDAEKRTRRAVFEGFHSFKEKEYAESYAIGWAQERVFEATIPAGSEYYENAEEIVSTALRVDKQLVTANCEDETK